MVEGEGGSDSDEGFEGVVGVVDLSGNGVAQTGLGLFLVGSRDLVHRGHNRRVKRKADLLGGRGDANDSKEEKESEDHDTMKLSKGQTHGKMDSLGCFLTVFFNTGHETMILFYLYPTK